VDRRYLKGFRSHSGALSSDDQNYSSRIARSKRLLHRHILNIATQCSGPHHDANMQTSVVPLSERWGLCLLFSHKGLDSSFCGLAATCNDRSSFCGTVAMIAAEQQRSLSVSGHAAIHNFFLLRACCKDISKATALSSHERTHCDTCKATHTQYDGLMWVLPTS
jgi:hypothetical protein